MKFLKKNINNQLFLEKLFKTEKFNTVIHLAAKPGVQDSFKIPDLYFENNIKNTYNLLKLSSKYKIKKFIFASSSSVYGDNNSAPFKEDYKTDEPESFYAATKKVDEIMASYFAKSYNMKCISLRFFTVYGPYGRKDMAYYKFTDSILNGKKIILFNNGKHWRSFTYISDAIKLIKQVIFSKKIKSNFEIFNIGNDKKISLLKFLKIIEENLKIKPKIQYKKKQKGDVIQTLSCNKKVRKFFNLGKSVNIADGLKKYIDWHRNFYK